MKTNFAIDGAPVPRNLASPEQGDLFHHVLDTYLTTSDGEIDNATLYKTVARKAGLCDSDLTIRTPIGSSGQEHNVVKRTIRWHQQTLKVMGVLEHADERGVWRLTARNQAGLHEARDGVRLVAFSTSLGVAVWGACETVMAGLDQPITLCVSSVPFLLRKPRAYGNPQDEQSYIDFLCRSFEPIVRHLAPGGSICLNISNDVFEPGLPSRSLYCERLLLALHHMLGLRLMDRLIWANSSKPPGPVQWASKKRVQLNTGYEFIYWLTNDPSRVRSDNRRVLEAHTKRHLAMIAAGGESREAVYGDGAYRLHPGSFGAPTPGKIPRNVISRGHRCADTLRYRADALAMSLPIHGAMQPLSIPDFLIRLLTVEGELVVDPFGGTATTGMAAERLGRRWIVAEKVLDYLRASAERFRLLPGFAMPHGIEHWPKFLERQNASPGH